MKTSKSQWYALIALVAVGLLAACGPVTAHSISCDDQMACSGHGTCIDTGGTAYCECDPGWGGTTCNGCAQGFSPNGEGDCIEGTSCDAICAAQGRECDEVAGDVICGDCLPGYYLEGDRCIQACAADVIDGELVPLDLYIMLDKSASMQDDGKWNAVVAAIQQFVNASDVAGIGVGLQFFPVDPAVAPNVGACTTDADCGLYGPCVPVLNQCNGSYSSDSCDPADYDDAAVPIQTLPGVQQTILNALNAESPNGDSTPTQPAYEGAVVYASNWAAANPDHLTFIVFATDGEPTNCTYNSIDDTASAAAAAAAGTPAVKTFVIGVGETLSSLHTIASSGGTGQAYIVDTGNVTQQFIDALNEIRNNGLCKYRIPQPEQGSPDYSLINVSLHDPNVPDSAETVFNVGDVTGCDVDGGWYYDDPADPQMIELCPATCDEVQQGNLSVEILVGCATIVK